MPVAAVPVAAVPVAAVPVAAVPVPDVVGAPLPAAPPVPEVHLSPVVGPDALGEGRRRVADDPHVPTDAPVGLVDASADASTQRSQVVVTDDCDLALDEFVCAAQRLADGSVLWHYGVVVEVRSRVEGAELASDTLRVAHAVLPGELTRRAEVAWLRTVPERFLPPASGAPVWRCTDVHRSRALFVDRMAATEQLPLGLDLNGSPVYVAFSFINGDKGGHVSISGKSGVATKTSYALFLLYLMFETAWGVRVRGGNAADRALVFSVKGEDLLHLDRPNRVFFADTDEAREAQAAWAALGVEQPGPFHHVRICAPRSEHDREGTGGPNVRTRRSGVQVYGWTPQRFVHQGLLQYAFEDLDAGQISFIEQVVRTQLVRYGYTATGDTSGRLALVDPEAVGDSVPTTFERARRARRARLTEGELTAAGARWVSSLAELVEFIGDKVSESSAQYDARWTGGVASGTVQAFLRRLWASEVTLRPLVAAGLAPVDRSTAVTVVDIHALAEDAQRFVVGAVLSEVWADHEDSSAAGRDWVVLDELNKYAPRQGRSPIKHLLVDIAGRGRSLGVLLLGAQQNPSLVDPNVTGNAALHVVGQIRAQEAGELGFLPPEMRARAQLVAPGTMITSQPLIPAPIPVRFPFPPYATRYAEVPDETEALADEGEQLIKDAFA